MSHISSSLTPHFDILDIDLFEARKRLAKFDSIEVREGTGEKTIRDLVAEGKDVENYITTGQYAKKYGVTTQTVGSWCRDGKVECIQTDGGHYRVKDVPPSH